MTIDATSSATSTAAATTQATGGALTGGKNEFLKLFMAQLQNQNPLDPQNGADMVAQLAQFSSVEQATETNQRLADLASAQAATSSASLSGLVGRDCNAAAADFQLDRAGGATAIPPVQVSADGPMTGASVVITDDSGAELRRIAIPDGASSAQLAWDGKTANGATAPAGSYHLAVDPGKSTSTITSQWHGRVDAVELTSGGARLRIGGVLVTPSAVRTIGTTSPSTTTTTTP